MPPTRRISAAPRARIAPVYTRPAARPPIDRSRLAIRPKPVKAVDMVNIVKPQPFAKPATPKQQPSQVLKRQFTQPAQTKAQPKDKRSRLQMALIGMAFLVFGLGLLVNVQTLQANHSAKAQVSALVKKSENTTTDSNAVVPSEAKPKGGGYAVAPNAPKYLKISKLGVNARVKPLGVNNKNELAAPSNIYDTGWYNASAHPGDPGSNGAVLIDGHVHGPSLPGVFVDIKKLVAGDTIEVVRGDNASYSYKVIKVQNYDANTIDMSVALSSVQPGQPGLNLITCGGPYDKKSGEYTQRTIVFAVQI